MDLHSWFKRFGLAFLMVMPLLMLGWSGIADLQANAASNNPAQKLVVVVPVKQSIESGLGQFVERAIHKAEDLHASLIVLNVNTPGGRVDSALDIGNVIMSSTVPTLAYVESEAASAGSYISLSADQIVMKPGSMIGAAALVDGSGKPVENAKTIAAWASMMRSVAEQNHRNGDIAEGMVDSQKVVELKPIQKVKQQGEIISLSANEALAVGYADHIANTLEEAVSYAGIDNPVIEHVNQTFFEKLATWLTHPVIATLLLFMGIAGVAIEMFVPGFGIPGVIGLLGFGLYFFGNFVAGFAEQGSIVLFVLGIVLLVCEVFVPSFGILGILGSLSLIAGVVMAAFDTSDALLSLGIAFVAALIVVVVVARIFKHRGIWNRFILKDSLTSEQGYLSSEDKSYLLHKEGVSLTTLRPSGTVVIDDEHVDVVTDGTFIEANRPIIVAKIEGTRVVVREKLIKK
ncbi:NfeD family protein [Paenibacillus selenitireducens]